MGETGRFLNVLSHALPILARPRRQEQLYDVRSDLLPRCPFATGTVGALAAIKLLLGFAVLSAHQFGVHRAGSALALRWGSGC